MHEPDALDQLQAFLEQEAGTPPMPDLTLDTGSTIAIHSMVRTQLLSQFHTLKLHARLNRTIDNLPAAEQQEAEAKKIVQMIAALDAETAEVNAPARIHVLDGRTDGRNLPL